MAGEGFPFADARAAEAFLRAGGGTGCFAVARPWLDGLPPGFRLVSGGWFSLTDAEREELLHARPVRPQ